MEAANALTALADDESVTSRDSKHTEPKETDQENQESSNKSTSPSGKRFIPEHKKPDAALTFPEKLMNLMRYAQKQVDEEGEDQETFCVAWLADGKSFVIRNPDEFTRKVLPKYFKATKFSSFTRKLYRWGFRQVNRGIGPDDPIIFGNEFFQRDEAELMAKMRSVTAASTRKAEASSVPTGISMNTASHNMPSVYNSGTNKRSLDTSALDALEERERDQKRRLIDHFMQTKAAPFQGHGLYGALPPAPAHPHQALNLNALRPHLGQRGMGLAAVAAATGGLKPYDILSQGMGPANPLLHSFQQSHAAAVTNPMPGQFSNTASTAEIVNAAINALRFA